MFSPSGPVRFVSNSIVIGAIAATIACSHSGSPTAPSTAAAPATVAASTGTTILGTISGVTASSRSALRMSSVAASAASGVTVTVSGTSISTTADANGSFTLSGIPPIQVVLTFSGPGVDATLPLGAVGSSDYVQINVTVTGSTATLNTQQTSSPDSTASLEGFVEAIDLDGRVVKVSGVSIEVPTNASLTRGGAPIALSDLRTGDRVHVVGVKDGSMIRASEIVAQNVAPTPPAPTPPPATVTFSGTVSSLTGTCPSLAFTANDTGVRTTSSTTFGGASCADIRNGGSVGVAGTKQSDGSVLASYVSVSVPRPAPVAPAVTVSFSGAVASVSGACPSLVLTVKGTVVATNSSTSFGGKTCSTIAAGDIVGGSGTKQTDGSVLAVSITSTSPTATSTFNAAITTLSGTCPSLVLTVGGKQVHTNASTIFGGAACSAIATGDILGVAGTTQSDGSILASYVSDSK
jgi:hypothetical protein